MAGMKSCSVFHFQLLKQQPIVNIPENKMLATTIKNKTQTQNVAFYSFAWLYISRIVIELT